MLTANHMTVLEPNILYLDEKPPKIVKTKRNLTNKKSTKKILSKMKQRLPLTARKRSAKIKQDYIIKKELCINEQQEEKLDNNDPHDPLYSEKSEIKCELDDDNQNESIEYNENEIQDTYENDDDDDHDYNYEHDIIESKLGGSDNDEYDDNENEEGEDDDEPLIVLTRQKGRPRKKIQEPDNEKIKAPRNIPCRELCKQNCVEKFTEEERQNICDYYWNLNADDRLTFIRKHIKARRFTCVKREKSNRSQANNCCCYLKAYKIGCKETTPDYFSDLKQVCRRFFEATLCTTNKFIRNVNNSAALEIKKELLLLSQMKLDNKKEKFLKPQQILDPETGNLLTFEPKPIKTIAKKSAQDKKEKKTRKRRKPEVPVTEHFPKPIKCAVRCIYKCHTKLNEEERRQICEFFWSLDYNRRKDFVLSTIEIKDIEAQTTPDFRKTKRPPRSYQTRYFLRSGGMREEKFRVCKHFYTKTLSISGAFIENAIEFADKTTGYYAGTDRRGARIAHNKKSEACKQVVLNHIKSYPLWIPNKKTKTKYLHHSLTIKKMYNAYKDKCVTDNMEYVSTHYYYKAFHDHFNLLFLANPHPKKGNAVQKGNPNISHYTGEEPGGCWIDSTDNKLDIRSINPAESLNICQHDSETSSEGTIPFSPATAAFNNPTSFMPPNSTVNQPHSLAVIRSDLDPTPYENLHQDVTLNMFKML